jgi:flagellar basal body-associated protein FliL
MLDNYNNSKLIDQGWEKMSGLLDRDMPVEKKERRLLWILLVPALFLIVTAIGLGVYSLLNSNEQPISVEEKYVPMVNVELDEPTPSNETEALSEEITEAQLIVEVDQSNQLTFNDISSASVKESPGLKQSVNRETSRNNINDQKVKTRDESPFVNQVQPAQLITNINERNTEISEPNQHDQKNNTLTNTDLPRTIETESIVLPIQSDLAAGTKAVEFLNSPVQFLSRSKNELPKLPAFAFEPMIKPVQLASNKVGVSLGLRASFNSSLGLQGIGVGPEARFSLSKNLNGYVGLLYENQKKDGLLNFNSREDALGQSNVTTPVAFFNDLQGDPLAAVSAQASYQDIQSLSNSFHYLHLPIGIEYMVGRAFSLYGGVRFSRMLSAPSKYQIAVVQGDLASQDLERLDGFSNNALFSNDLVRKNDISATLGASLYLGRRWALTAEYNHGILPIIGIDDTDGSNAFNRIFSVGLSYHFSRS